MNGVIFHFYLNLNYHYIKSTDFAIIIIISPHLANNVDKIFVFLEKKLEMGFNEVMKRNIVAFSDE